MTPDLSLRSVSPDLADMLDQARGHQMTDAEIEAQRRSWCIGELMLDDASLTRERAEALYDEACAEAAAGGL
jgi:hypothetical protein